MAYNDTDRTCVQLEADHKNSWEKNYFINFQPEKNSINAYSEPHNIGLKIQLAFMETFFPTQLSINGLIVNLKNN